MLAPRWLQLRRARHDSEARLASAMIDVQRMQKQLLRLYSTHGCRQSA
eukprot:COSAG01_NODE_25116_length_755_cov_0.503049_1_plen_47_part_10